MRWYKLILTFGFIFMLIGCGTNPKPETMENNDNIELTKITTNQVTDQQASNQAKDILNNYEGITTVKAVNTSKILLIAIEVKHSKRFNLAKTQKQLTKKMKNSFPDMKVVFSTDKKLILELDQLEKDLQANAISNKALNKKIKHLVSLTKEQT